MDLGLKGKSVLVTGGSRGIGLACARSFAAEGCRVHLAARNRERLEAAMSSLGGKAEIHHAWALNVFAYVNLTREIFPRMRARRSGVVVNLIGMMTSRSRWPTRSSSSDFGTRIRAQRRDRGRRR